MSEGENQRNNNYFYLWGEYLWFGVVIVSLVINLRVIWSVFHLPQHTRRSHAVSLVLVTHLAFIAAILGVISMASVRKYFYEAPLKWTDENTADTSHEQILCRLWKYFETVLLCVFPLNIVGITHERTKCYGNRRKNKLPCLLFSFWTIVLVYCIPIGLMYNVDPKTGMCQVVPLFNNLWITVLYGLLRFQLFHVTPVAYIIHAFVQIYVKLHRIHNNLHRYTAQASLSRGLFGSDVSSSPIGIVKVSFERRFRSIQLVYTYLTSFILIWFATGVLYLAEIVLNLPLLFDNPPSIIREDSSFTEKYGLTLLCLYLYILISPCINLGLLKGINWRTCGRSDVTAFSNVNRNDHSQVASIPLAAPRVAIAPVLTAGQQRIIGQRLKNYDNEEVYLSAADLVTTGKPSVSIEMATISGRNGHDDEEHVIISKLSTASEFEGSPNSKGDPWHRVPLKMLMESPKPQKPSRKTTSYPDYGVASRGKPCRINLAHDNNVVSHAPRSLSLLKLDSIPGTAEVKRDDKN